MQFFCLARIRAHQSVFVFLLHPSPLSHIILFHNGLGVKEKPIFPSPLPSPSKSGEGHFYRKIAFPFSLLRRKLQKGGGFRPKVFTQNQLIHNHSRKVGEGVKAKNEKPLCAHYARARPPHLHSEHRAPHLLRPEALPPLRGAHSSSRDSTATSPLCTPPSDPFFHKNHRQTCPPPNNSYICSTHT